ncbi:MAG: sensor histidine kinase, partial [Lachnospiraceae bacterium]|nr:sensor histidine kinase [Lachnospiraceae bacterium]
MENMRVLANRKIKMLFLQILLCMLAFLLLSVTLTVVEETAFYVILYPLCMGGAVLAVCYRYFREQDRMLEDAVAQIQGFRSGDREARIACDEEGELYRLFHEVNSLATILNAQVRKEVSARKFLQNTISDISHQLKTPLAAL